MKALKTINRKSQNMEENTLENRRENLNKQQEVTESPARLKISFEGVNSVD